jgi:hypothetical protein
MALIIIFSIIALLWLAVAMFCLVNPTVSDRTKFIGACIGILGIIIYLVGFVVISPVYSTSEIKTVNVCDKFTSDGRYSIATDDGNTYAVDYNVYGFIPKTGNATLEFYTDGFTEHTKITKIYSNTTCQEGCSQ